MTRFFISNREIGYVVMRLEDDGEGWISTDSIRNFGDRQTDAIEFRDDCNDGMIDDKRLKLLIQTYTEQPYKYMGKGILRKQKA